MFAFFLPCLILKVGVRLLVYTTPLPYTTLPILIVVNNSLAEVAVVIQEISKHWLCMENEKEQHLKRSNYVKQLSY